MFYTRRIEISAYSDNELNSICDKIRYFEIDGKECRALKDNRIFEKNFTQKWNEEINMCKIYVYKIPKNLNQK